MKNSGKIKRNLKTLLGCSIKYFEGDTVREMIKNLKNNPDYNGQTKRSVMLEKLVSLESIIEEVKYEGEELKEGSSFTDSQQIYITFRELAKEKQEHFCILLLDNKHKVIEKVLISKGILNKTLVHPREVFAPAIEKRSAAIVIVHNHPSGDPTPSGADKKITARLKEVGEIVGINVLDHVIVGESSYYSFMDEDIF